MVNSILTDARIKYRRARYTAKPLPSTYAVYFDEVESSGADLIGGLIKRHQITIELYEAKPDDAAEEALEAALDARGLEWTRQDRYWLQEEQRYQVIYEFNYLTKRRL